MKVEVSHHTDASEPDAQGFHDYCYEYDVFTFSDGSTSFLARSYRDEPQRASFVARCEDGRRHVLTGRDLRHPLFIEAAAYLRGVGKTDLTWLDSERGAYVPTSPLPRC